MAIESIKNGLINYKALAAAFSLLCSFSTLSLASSDTTQKANNPSFTSITKHVKAGVVVEDCLLVKKGKRIKYKFTSNSPLSFNFHYHDKAKGKTIYLYGPQQVSGNFAENTYEAQKTQIMCLMWKNKGNTKAKLKYSHWMT
ncbi:hypothetical protein [Neptunomonas japonica]|uniref:hypothetical protein n=1 Tax=Neptunomonas japonica TaxID=417574 RepID=UPI001914E776|nr:hypothetical protein [Neptunomonas japonica]